MSEGGMERGTSIVLLYSQLHHHSVKAVHFINPRYDYGLKKQFCDTFLLAMCVLHPHTTPCNRYCSYNTVFLFYDFFVIKEIIKKLLLMNIQVLIYTECTKCQEHLHQLQSLLPSEQHQFVRAWSLQGVESIPQGCWPMLTPMLPTVMLSWLDVI